MKYVMIPLAILGVLIGAVCLLPDFCSDVIRSLASVKK